MKIVVSRADLITMVGHVQSVVASKPPIPVLGNVLLEAHSGQLTISSTDLVISIRCSCGADVSEEGAITLPAKRLFSLIRELSAPLVEITAVGESVQIHAGTSRFKIQGMQGKEFPSFPDLSEAMHLSLPTPLLKEMLARTAFAAGRDDQRPVLNGVLLQCYQDRVVFMSTNGKCVAKLEAPVSTPFAETQSYVLPIKAVEEILKILDEEVETVKVSLAKNKLGVEMGMTLLVTQLLTGQYPDVMRIVPPKSDNRIALHRDELISLLRQVALFTSDQVASVRFTLTPGTLHLSINNGEVGEGDVNMPVNYSGNQMDIAFNPHYFLEILRNSKDEAVNFEVTDSYNPALITDSSSALFIIMPMRL